MPVEKIGIGENTQLAGIDQITELFLNGFELFDGMFPRVILGRDLCRLHGVGFDGRSHINPVQGVQVIEVDDMIMKILGTENQIPDQRGVFRNMHVQGVFNATRGCKGMGVGAHAAGSLGEMLGVLGITPFENDLQSPEKLGTGPCFGNSAVVYFDFDAQMALDSGDGIDHNGAAEIAFWCGTGRRRGFGMTTGHMLILLEI